MIPYVRIRVPPPLISLLLSLDKGYSRHLVKAKSICVTMRTQTNVYKKVQYGAILWNKVFFTAMLRNWCINAPVSYFPESWVILISQWMIQDTGYISIVIDNLTNAYNCYFQFHCPTKCYLKFNMPNNYKFADFTVFLMAHRASYCKRANPQNVCVTFYSLPKHNKNSH